MQADDGFHARALQVAHHCELIEAVKDCTAAVREQTAMLDAEPTVPDWLPSPWLFVLGAVVVLFALDKCA